MPQRQLPAATDDVVPEPPDPSSPLSRAAGALGEAVARLTGAEAVEPSDQSDRKGAASALSGVVSGLAGAARVGGKGAVVGGTFLTELLTTTATRLPMRDKATLLNQHPDQDTEQIADSMVAAASKVSGAIGGAAGGLAAAQWLATPSLIAIPVELAAETLLVAAVELKLVAELHEIYDARPPGELGDRASAYLGSWTAQRGLSGEGQSVGLASRLASAGTAALPNGSPAGWRAISARSSHSWLVPSSGLGTTPPAPASSANGCVPISPCNRSGSKASAWSCPSRTGPAMSPAHVPPGDRRGGFRG